MLVKLEFLIQVVLLFFVILLILNHLAVTQISNGAPVGQNSF